MQVSLFYESYEDAIRDTVMQVFGGLKSAGVTLWPTQPADEAGRRLAHCLNPDKREKLCINELALIRREARKAGCHILAAYEMRDAGYTEPQPIAPQDEAAQLKREYIAAIKSLHVLQARIDRNPILGGL